MSHTGINWLSDAAQTVLFADDEKMLRDLVGTMLKKGGYRVLTASSGRECVEVFRQQPDDISCVIIDWTMPGLKCSEVICQLHEIRMGIPTIVTSGFAEKQIRDQINDEVRAHFLQKPFGLKQLQQTLGDALDVTNSAA